MDEGFEGWLNCPTQGIRLPEGDHGNGRWSCELDGEQRVGQRGCLAISASLEGMSLPVSALQAQGGTVKPLGGGGFIVGFSMAMMSSLAFGGPPGCQEISFLVS